MSKAQELEKYNKLIWSIVYKILTKVNDKYYYQGLEEDLFQEGYIGLLSAYDKYDKTSEIQFSTFAYKYIYGYCFNFLKKEFNSLNCEDIDSNPTILNKCYEMDEYCDFNLIAELNERLKIIGKKVPKEEEGILNDRLCEGHSIKRCAERNNCSTTKITYTVEKYKKLIKEIINKEDF